MQQTEKRPLCACHGVPKLWHRKGDGGFWRCQVKHDEARKRYNNSAKGRACKDRYDLSENGQLRRRVDRLRILDRREEELLEQLIALEEEEKILRRRIANGSGRC